MKYQRRREGGDGWGSVTQDERCIVLRCQAGATDAFRLIVERYGNVLHGTALLMVGDRGEAEDAVQEAFTSAWRGIRTFDVDRPLRPWLIRILVNHILKRRRRRVLRLVRLSFASPVHDPSARVPELAEKAWERSEVRRALAGLPADSERVVILRYFTGLSIAEAAEVLGVPEGTVKSRLHRALGRLREELTKRGVTDSDAHTRQDEKSRGTEGML